MARIWEDWGSFVVGGSLEEAGEVLVLFVSWVVGSGVPSDTAVGGFDGSSSLACVVCIMDPGLGFRVVGGRYVWPMAGVKLGSVETVESILVKEVTVESCVT